MKLRSLLPINIREEEKADKEAEDTEGNPFAAGDTEGGEEASGDEAVS